jgi:hypothetical protein
LCRSGRSPRARSAHEDSLLSPRRVYRIGRCARNSRSSCKISSCAFLSARRRRAVDKACAARDVSSPSGKTTLTIWPFKSGGTNVRIPGVWRPEQPTEGRQGSRSTAVVTFVEPPATIQRIGADRTAALPQKPPEKRPGRTSRRRLFAFGPSSLILPRTSTLRNSTE